MANVASLWWFAGDASHLQLSRLRHMSTFLSCKWVRNTRVRNTFVWVKDMHVNGIDHEHCRHGNGLQPFPYGVIFYL